MSRPKRVLFVVNVAWFFVSHRLPLGEAAREAGYEVHLAAAPDWAEDVDRIQRAGIEFHALPIARSRLGLRSELRTIKALAATYRRVRPDLVHLVTIKPVIYGNLVALRAAPRAIVNALSGLGFVFIARGAAAAVRRAAVTTLYRCILNRPNSRTVFQNVGDLEEFVERGIVAPQRAVLIRGSGVDLAVFTPEREAAGDPVVLLPARMLWDKGIREFADAAGMLLRRGLKARFVLVGPLDPENRRGATREEIEKLCADGGVDWWGMQKDMQRVYAACHVVCLPSYGEGLAKTLLEASACGRAIVTTDTPGCREVVRDGENGLLVPPRDAEALAKALEVILTDAGLRHRLGARGRMLAVSDFGIERVVQQTLHLYRELLADG